MRCSQLLPHSTTLFHGNITVLRICFKGMEVLAVGFCGVLYLPSMGTFPFLRKYSGLVPTSLSLSRHRQSLAFTVTKCSVFAHLPYNHSIFLWPPLTLDAILKRAHSEVAQNTHVCYCIACR